MNTIGIRARCVAGCAVVAAGVVGAPSNAAITYYYQGYLWVNQIQPDTQHLMDLIGYGIAPGSPVNPDIWVPDHGVRLRPQLGAGLSASPARAVQLDTFQSRGTFALQFLQPIRAGYFSFWGGTAYLFSGGQQVGFMPSGTAGFVSDLAIDEIRFGDGSSYYYPRLDWAAYATPIPAPGAGLALLLIPRSGRRRRA